MTRHILKLYSRGIHEIFVLLANTLNHIFMHKSTHSVAFDTLSIGLFRLFNAKACTFYDIMMHHF